MTLRRETFSKLITFHAPPRFRNPEGPAREVIEMEWRPGWTLKRYYADTRYSRHLQSLNTRYKVRKMPSREAVRSSHIPAPGDLFVFVGPNVSMG